MFVDLDVRNVELDGFPGVSVDLKPMETGDFQRAAAFFFKTEVGIDKGTLLKILVDEAFGKLARELLPKYCVAVKGLEVRVGGTPRPATGLDLVESSRLFNIAVVAFFNLFRVSSLEVEEAKKSV